MRYCRDKIREDSGVIAEMSRWLTEESSRIFDSDKVRYSARIREAENVIRNMRDTITENADRWESEIDAIKYRIQNDVSYGFDEIGIKTWLETVLRGDEVPVTRTAPVARISAAASRTNRLQMASGLLGDADAQITVYTDNEVVIQVQAESGGTLVPVDDARVTYRDALDPDSEAEDRYPDKGVVLIPINNLTSDEYDVYHLAVDIDGTASGYQHVVFENLDIERGTVYTCLLTPVGESAANADEGRPYPSMMSFDTKDIMKSEYDMIYFPANDYEIEIHLGVENADAVQSVKMRYYDLDGDACDVDPTDIAGNEYIFKGPWKQRFSPFATEDQRPAFIITDTEGTQTFPSQLVSMKGATDEPINEGTGAEGGVFANVLGDPLQLSCKIPVE